MISIDYKWFRCERIISGLTGWLSSGFLRFLLDFSTSLIFCYWFGPPTRSHLVLCWCVKRAQHLVERFQEFPSSKFTWRNLEDSLNGTMRPTLWLLLRVLFTDFTFSTTSMTSSLSFLTLVSPFKLIRTFYLRLAMTSSIWPFLFYSIFMDIWLLQMVLLPLHGLSPLFNSLHSSRHARIQFSFHLY